MPPGESSPWRREKNDKLRHFCSIRCGSRIDAGDSGSRGDGAAVADGLPIDSVI